MFFFSVIGAIQMRYDDDDDDDDDDVFRRVIAWDPVTSHWLIDFTECM